MSTKRMLIIAAFAVAFIAALVIILRFAPGSRGRQEAVALPETPVSAPPQNGSNNAESVSRVELNADTVRDVVATLERPAEYSREIMVESFWDGGNTVYNFSVAVSEEMTAVRLSHAGTMKTIILRDGYAYIRNDGDRTFSAFPLWSPNAADEYQMIATYEDVIALERDAIIRAELRAGGGGEPMIFVSWRSGELGYVTEALISVRLGLLVQAVRWDGDEMVDRMTAGEADLSPVDAELFVVSRYA